MLEGKFGDNLLGEINLISWISYNLISILFDSILFSIL